VDPKQKAFLDLIAWSEGTSTHPLTKWNGYDVIVTGVRGQEVFSSFANHPFAAGREPQVIRRNPLLTSTAAGRYQLLLRYWKIYREQLGLIDFSPASQDAVALQQIKERGALPLIANSQTDQAIRACSNVWASLPGNNYGQGGKTMKALLDHHSTLIEA
jgi:muramidase (phage lysozyme)